MKALIPVFLVMAAGLNAQSLPKGFVPGYDKARDITTLESRTTTVTASRESSLKDVASVGFRGDVSYPGKRVSDPAKVTFFLNFMVSGKPCGGICFRDAEKLILFADAKRLELTTIWMGGGADPEEVQCLATYRDMEAIARAKRVRFQLGTFAAEFSPADLETLKNMLELGTPTK